MQGEEGKADVYFDDGDWWKIRSDKKETSEPLRYTKPCSQVNTTLHINLYIIKYMMVPHNTQFQCRSIKLAKYLAELNVSVPRSEVYAPTQDDFYVNPKTKPESRSVLALLYIQKYHLQEENDPKYRAILSCALHPRPRMPRQRD